MLHTVLFSSGKFISNVLNSVCIFYFFAEWLGFHFVFGVVLFPIGSVALSPKMKETNSFMGFGLHIAMREKIQCFFYSSVFGLNGGCEKRSIEITKAQKCVRIEKHVQMPIILFYLSLHSITSETTTRTIQTNTTFFYFLFRFSHLRLNHMHAFITRHECSCANFVGMFSLCKRKPLFMLLCFIFICVAM